MFISGQEVLLLCSCARNLCQAQSPCVCSPVPPAIQSPPSLINVGVDHTAHAAMEHAWIPPLSRAPQALTSSQMWDISPLPFTSKPRSSLSFPSRTTRAIVFYSLCVLLCGKIPEPREHKTWPLFRNEGGKGREK